MRHREIDRADPAPLGERGEASGEMHGGFRTADDLDLLPREGARDAEAERLAHRLLAGEAPGIALGRVRPRLAVGLLGRREAAVAEPCVALERAPDAPDLDQVRADTDHRCSSSHSGKWAIDDTIPSGCARARSTASGRNFPVRTSTLCIPTPCAPATSLSRSSPTIHALFRSASSASKAASK